MREQLSRLYNAWWMPFKKQMGHFLKFIRKRDENDNHFNNPFVIN